MRAVIALGFLFASGGCLAQSVHYYKSVHADGTVAYSDSQPRSAASVEEVKVHEEGASARREGEQRLEAMRKASEQLDEERAEREASRRKYEARLAAARDEVAEAERNLANARDSKHSATRERIALAEERVRLARQRLKEVQNAGL